MYCYQVPVEEIFGRILPPRALTLCELAERCAQATGITVKEMLSKSRKQEKVFARFLFVRYAKSELRLSLRQIGEYIGRRDHTTIIHALKEIRNLRRDPLWISYVQNFEENKGPVKKPWNPRILGIPIYDKYEEREFKSIAAAARELGIGWWLIDCSFKFKGSRYYGRFKRL